MIRANRNYDEYFGADRCSSHNNIPNRFEWVNDGTGDISIFVDAHITRMEGGLSDIPQYGWLLESRSFIPHIYDHVERNIQYYSAISNGIFTHDERLAEASGFIYVLSNAAPWVLDTSTPVKTNLVSMISSTKDFSEGHRKRLAYVDKFRGRVDLFGRGFNEIATKEEGLQKYMFSISIENADYPCYFTERLTDCFATSTIPVYYGTRRVSQYFNEDGIIWLDDDFDIDMLSEDLYYSKLDAIEENRRLALEFPTSEDWIADNVFERATQ